MDNIILMTDSYKASHFLQTPSGVEYSFSYIESRGGEWDRTLFFGLQMFLKKYFSKPITMNDIDEAEEFFRANGEPFNRPGWEHIVFRHRGMLPIAIHAVPEGTLVAGRNVLVTIVNTDPACHWLPSYLETALLRAVWYPTTVATNSFYAKLAILDGLKKTSTDPWGQIDWKLHDFGARGVSSSESAAIGGAAHLVNFKGSDTVEGVMALRKYYGADCAGGSIPAAEHSTITSWGREREVDAYRNMLQRFAKPHGMVAVVSDSYDLDYAVRNIWGGILRQEVIDSGATVIIRPDSGEPTTVPVDVVLALTEAFGYELNKKGFKVLPSCVRVLQGDGINIASIKEIMTNMIAAGLSADNIAFGMGGALLQQIHRDTLKFAMKCSAVSINGVWHDVYKAPTGDLGKRSKRGRLALIATADGKGHETVSLVGHEDDNLLEEVFRNGQMPLMQSLTQIRERANDAARRMSK